VAISAIIVACIGCAIDPEMRKTFVQSANDCYRVLIVAAILSAALMAAGLLWDWGACLDGLLNLTGVGDLAKQVGARSAIAAIFAFAVIGLNSLSATPASGAATAPVRSSLRIALWSLYLLISFWLLNLIMFYSSRD
jgi:hypothetical protein